MCFVHPLYFSFTHADVLGCFGEHHMRRSTITCGQLNTARVPDSCSASPCKTARPCHSRRQLHSHHGICRRHLSKGCGVCRKAHACHGHEFDVQMHPILCDTQPPISFAPNKKTSNGNNFRSMHSPSNQRWVNALF